MHTWLKPKQSTIARSQKITVTSVLVVVLDATVVMVMVVMVVMVILLILAKITRYRKSSEYYLAISVLRRNTINEHNNTGASAQMLKQ